MAEALFLALFVVLGFGTLFTLATGGAPLLILGRWVEDRGIAKRTLAKARLQEAKNEAARIAASRSAAPRADGIDPERGRDDG